MFLFNNNASAINHLITQASIQFQNGKLDEAQNTYDLVLKRDPGNVIALNELGRIFLVHRKLEDAASLFRKAIGVNPETAIPYKNLGTTLCEMGFCDEGFAALREYAKRTYQRSDDAAPHKIRHDQEQMAYLHDSLNNYTITEAQRTESHALNPNLKWQSIMQQWIENSPRIVVIDNFLTRDALHSLQKFAWGSTIWQRVYKNGYLGALPEHGIGSPLLAQIIDELKTSLSLLLGDMSLLQFWAFKYDSTMKGIGLHADFATININFWVTPDEANKDPQRGGMIIWDKPTPADWDFKTYNQNEDAAREFLTRNNATPTIIPYQANRAVLFDSRLFHETDIILFQEGYINRRIGFTLLFGKKILL
ncbi:MAG: tetratricopeptide repeat protein [Alphaproteobacteria bacterium]|nr:tetratricopeptide repeat protein [Alphaproteobacteria bacterium]